MKQILFAVLVLAGIALATQSNIRAKQLDSEHLQVSCANGADPGIKAAESYNTIVISCTDERKVKP